MGNPDRTVVVTGGLGGIGGGIVRRFLAAGDQVIIADLARGDADERLAGLAVDGNEPLFVPTDVCDAASCEALAADASGRGAVRVLVNCAGGGAGVPFPEQTVEDWERMRQLNLDGVFYVSRSMTPHIIASGSGGRIVHISSISWLTGGVDPAYAAAKGGVVSLTWHMARQLGPKGVTVNAVVPGIIETENMHRLFPADLVQRLRDKAPDHTPVGRLGQPEDIATAVYFLSSPEAGFITGAILPVTGGRDIPLPLTDI